MRATPSLRGYVKPTPLLPSLLALSTLLWITGVPALAQIDTFIASSGIWSEDEIWSLDAVPVRTDDCVLPANSMVTSDLAGECANFTLGTGGSLTVNPSYLFVQGSSFTNQAAIRVGSSNGLAFPQSSVTATITGAGTIMLTNANASFSKGQNTVINADNTIQGQGFMGFTNNSGGKYVFPRDQG